MMTGQDTTGLLVILTGKEKGKTFSISGPSDIGRDDGNEVCIPDPSVSRRHARIQPSGTGFMVTDLGSRNQIVVRGETVTECELSIGDEFTLGGVRIKILTAESREDPAIHAVIPVPPRIPVKVRNGSDAKEFFDTDISDANTSRKTAVVLGLIVLIALAAFVLGPIITAGPQLTTLDVIVDQGLEKAVGVWDWKARIPAANGLRVKNKHVAEVSVDSPNGFIIKVAGRNPGVTEAEGTNAGGGRTIVRVIVKARADLIWELASKTDTEKRREALNRIAWAHDIESHSPYEAMKKYGLAAEILNQLNPRPKEYSEAALKERELKKMIDAEVEECVKSYRLARSAGRDGSAAAELRRISELIPDTDDYRNQKAKLLYIKLIKSVSEGI